METATNPTSSRQSNSQKLKESHIIQPALQSSRALTGLDDCATLLAQPNVGHREFRNTRCVRGQPGPLFRKDVIPSNSVSLQPLSRTTDHTTAHYLPNAGDARKETRLSHFICSEFCSFPPSKTAFASRASQVVQSGREASDPRNSNQATISVSPPYCVAFQTGTLAFQTSSPLSPTLFSHPHGNER